MPELPEVETTCRGIKPFVEQQTIVDMNVWQSKLRWPIPDNLALTVKNQTMRSVSRRGKYIIIELSNHHYLIIHLGMSGNLRVLTDGQPRRKHDHWQIIFTGGVLRYHDPRRFGSLHYSSSIERHPLLASLGIEPLTDTFDGDYLYRCSRNKSQAVKGFIMDSKITVGVGNIYANESLFLAGISPIRPAKKISIERYRQLATHIKQVLERAIEQGGTTLRDYVNSDGDQGYFQQTLNVYGRAELPCVNCVRPLKLIKQNQRATVYCTHCQR